MAKNRINICCASNSSFARHLGVMIYSLLSNTRNPEKVNIFVADGGILDYDKRIIYKIVRSFDAKITYITPSKKFFSGLKTYNHLGIETYYRFFLIEKLKLDKLLYLDSDLVVNGDVEELYNKELKKNTLLAVKDSGISYKKKQSLGIDGKDPYFNAGVLLINSKKWREDRITEKSIKYLINNADRIEFADQDALNAVLQGKWAEVDPSWNVLVKNKIYSFIPSHFRKKFFNLDDKFTTSEKKIIHYAGFSKPWYFLDFVFAKKEYVNYFKKSGWPGKVYLDSDIKKLKIRFKENTIYFKKLINRVFS